MTLGISRPTRDAPSDVTSPIPSYCLSASGGLSPVENAASFFPVSRTRQVVRFGRAAVILTLVAGITVEAVHGPPLPGFPTPDAQIVVKDEWYVPQEHTHSEIREGPPRDRQILEVSSVGTPSMASGQFTVTSGSSKV